jgi:hypothetical protein
MRRPSSPPLGLHHLTFATEEDTVEDTEEAVLVAGERDRARGGREVVLLRLTRQFQERRVAKVRH